MVLYFLHLAFKPWLDASVNMTRLNELSEPFNVTVTELDVLKNDSNEAAKNIICFDEALYFLPKALGEWLWECFPGAFHQLILSNSRQKHN